tara:strand:- start:2765 stop:2974 length:210 start_codon:yes stop_codon:yes gene_type:complete
MTQNDTLLNHMMTGRSISPLEALGLYGVFRLAARMFELKAMGVDIQKNTKVDINGKQYAEYFVNATDEE